MPNRTFPGSRSASPWGSDVTEDVATEPTSRPAPWDRAAIAVLGAAGCALSYDALQQMAAAIHVRGLLTYLFPLVIDGFIAYGVRALLVLRAAPFRARLYVWTLFGTATTASIWANALHAVRLNQATTSTGLRLGDVTVGVLSTIAPLALAGAVHLYILIARHPADARMETGPVILEAEDDNQLPPQWDETSESDADPATGTDEPPPPVRRVGRPPGAEMHELLDLVRPVFAVHEKPTRDVIRQAIRDAELSVSEDRLTELMNSLRTE